MAASKDPERRTQNIELAILSNVSSGFRRAIFVMRVRVAPDLTELELELEIKIKITSWPRWLAPLR
jgi:hypothetical protein